MGDGSLTQEEIDRLLQGADSFSAAPAAVNQNQEKIEELLTPLERDMIGDAVSQAWKSGVPSLGQILKKNIRLGTPYGETISQAGLEDEVSSGFVCLSQTISGSIQGKVGLFIDSETATRLSGIVMGGDGNGGNTRTLDSAEIATVKDTLGPFHKKGLQSMGNRLAQPVKTGQLDARTTGGATFPFSEEAHYLRVQIPFAIEGILDSRLLLVFPITVAKQILQGLRNSPVGGGAGSAEGFGFSSDFSDEEDAGPRADIKEVQFPSFTAGHQGPGDPNLNLLMDVQMTLTVELGRTRMYIKEILGLGEGSIIELDKLAGEPVDLLVNGKLIAKGEVVVIDENFGVRVTDIVSPVDRLKAHRKG